MSLDQRKYEHSLETILRDVRPFSQRVADGLKNPSISTAIFILAAGSIYANDWALAFADLIMVFMGIYFLWLISRDRALAFKLPIGSRHADSNNGRGGKSGKSEGILYLGNTEETNEEVWFTNSDIRTHILYLGTTGSGKTEGLKSLVTNALSWSSGFVFIDGKADTDLWSSLSSLVRRFGRDDDLLVLNYMTGNSDIQAPSNTMNPFSSGSASYLTNMLVSLMPESGGDNAMWKERAVSLIGAIMPPLTWKRDNQEVPLSVRTIRDYLSLNNVIKLARDDAVPKEILFGLNGYLDTLPGYIAEAYDDEGKVKPPGPDTPPYNTETTSQQHGYLAMQFTRALQSLGDDYGYIFDTQAADVDMVDIVLNRRILVVLVPALEKSGDEIANLGKIVAASIKGMMGSTLGSTVEGASDTVIENKPTHSSTPFMTVFDEVGYYVAEGMAVMAAQARSLGFSLVFAGQDLPALKKRVREEANSITANCNIKLFGKLEDPTETKEFFEKTVGSALVTEVSGYQMSGGSELGNYHDSRQASVQTRARASYDSLRGFKEGQAVITYGEAVFDCAVFYSNPGFAKAMRVTRFMALPAPDENIVKYSSAITKLRDLMVNKTWTAQRSDVAVETSPEIAALGEGFVRNNKESINPVDAGITALIEVYAISNEIPAPSEDSASNTGSITPASTAPAAVAENTAPPAAQAQKPTASSAKPSIFGAAPAQPKATSAASTEQTSAPAQPKETISPEDAKLIQAAEDVKKNVFSPEKDNADALIKAAENVKKNLFGQGPENTSAAPKEPEKKKETPAEITQDANNSSDNEKNKTPSIFSKSGKATSSDEKDNEDKS
ncbi:MAG: TraM recognition domain-containing protein [Alphaproteobacteria bacterium]|nr:TraM recognition domain-containing protein [Alphaproteobacteria bacterium]